MNSAMTVLQVQCGTCLQVVNVSATFLPTLLTQKTYSCPHCQSQQSINLSPQQETQLRLQAQRLLQQQQQQAALQAATRTAQQQQAARLQQQQQQQLQLQQAAVAAARGVPTAQPAGTGQAQQHAQVTTGDAAATAAYIRQLQQKAQQQHAQLAQQRQQQLAQHRARLLHAQQQHQHGIGKSPAGSKATVTRRPLGTHVIPQQALPALQQQLREQLQHQQHPGAAANAAQLAAAMAAHLQAAQAAAAAGRALPVADLPALGAPAEEEEEEGEEEGVGDTFLEYKPAKLDYGLPHPDAVVETASLAAVEPPDIHYKLHAHRELVETGCLSALQLEAVVYACQRHQQLLPDGASRGGFFIGDGAGVGKGRTIAGLVLENWRAGRRRHLWLSVGSDLKFDARRDLDDVGATDIPIHALNKLPYAKLDSAKVGVKEGVIFLTYSSLIASSDRGRSRLKQLEEWCGKDFDGLIVFDESHKAKNLVPEAGARPTQVGKKVLELQSNLPAARVVYCSATGASEPRNMGYMTRLGLWGEGNPAFRDFGRFLEAVQGKGGGTNMAALELVAMDMKAQGMYACRTLSFAGAEFETIEAPLEEPVSSQYRESAALWNQLFREFVFAEEQVENVKGAVAHAKAASASEASGPAAAATEGGRGSGRRGGFGDARSMLWRSFWATHQRFFRHMCMAAKVPAVVRMAKAAVSSGKCVVIGLQSTGEARTVEAVQRSKAERSRQRQQQRQQEGQEAGQGGEEKEGDDDELDDFVSGPRELLLKLVEDYYPLPPDPSAEDAEAGTSSDDEDFVVASMNPAAAANAARLEGRDQSLRASKAKAIRYKEYSSDEDIVSSSEEDESGSGSGEEGSGSGEGEESEEGSAPSDSGSKGGSDADGASSSSGSDDEYDPTKKGTASASDAEEKPKESLTSQQREQKRLDAEMVRMRREQAVEALAQAKMRKEQVKGVVSQLDLPNNPLDMLIDMLGGPSQVAEMTGRKGRLVRNPSSNTVKFEARNASGVDKGASLELINVHEKELFMSGEKLVAIISEAASAGISLHADRRAANQRRRVHLTLELPWSADRAIQQFGRSHRANQATGPQYRLIFTPLGGERRFAAAVARRLASLGALTQGDRRAGPSLSSYNYESVWGQRALREMYAAIMEESSARPPLVLPMPCRPGPDGQPPQMTVARFMGRARALLLNAGVIRYNKAVGAAHINEYLAREEGAPTVCGTIEERDKTDVPRFLNRLLGLDPDAQALLFDYYQATLEALTARARREGALDEGIIDVSAHSIQLEGPPCTLHKDATTGAATLLYTIQLDRGLPWEAALDRLEQHQQQEAAAGAAAADLAVPALIGGVLASVPVGQEAVAAVAQQPAQQQQQQTRPGQQQQQQQPNGRQESGQQDIEVLPAVVQAVEAQGPAATPETANPDAVGAPQATVTREPVGTAAPAVQHRRRGRSRGQAPQPKPQQQPQEGAAATASASGDAVVAAPKTAEQESQAAADPAAAGSTAAQQSEAGASQAALELPAVPSRDAPGVKVEEKQPQASAAPPDGATVDATVEGKGQGDVATVAGQATGGKVASGRMTAAKQRALLRAQRQQAAAAAGSSPATQPQKKNGKQQQQREQEQEVGLGNGKRPVEGGEEGQQGAKRGKGPAGAAVVPAEVVDLTEEEEGGTPPGHAQGKALPSSEEGAKPGRPKWGSGFYQARAEGVGGRVHVLLAVQIPTVGAGATSNKSGPGFTIYRPATGRNKAHMSLQELKDRYIPLQPSACRAHWQAAYEAAGQDKPGARAGRKRTLHILGGAVMRSWAAVQRALVRHMKSSERRVRVLRIMTTGEQSQRLVGMLIPEPAVPDVVGELARPEEDGEVVEAAKGKEEKGRSKEKRRGRGRVGRGNDVIDMTDD
ncbi:hypothetical protein N2152v2_004815 [Parachlorella kessleri]